MMQVLAMVQSYTRVVITGPVLIQLLMVILTQLIIVPARERNAERYAIQIVLRNVVINIVIVRELVKRVVIQIVPVAVAVGLIKAVAILGAVVLLITKVKPEPAPQLVVMLSLSVFATNPVVLLGPMMLAESEVAPLLKCTKPEVAALVPTPPQDVFLIQVVEE